MDRALPDDGFRHPDPQALFEQGARLEARARQVLAEAEQCSAQLDAQAEQLFDLSARSGSIDALLALARLAVADGVCCGAAQSLLTEAARLGADAGRPAVVVSFDVLGPGLSLDGPDGEVERSPTLTVISPQPERAARTLLRISRALLSVDQHGRLHDPADVATLDRGESYTPNWISDVMIGSFGARVLLDTNAQLWSAMGRTMVRVIADALAEDGVPAVLAGTVENLDGYFREWDISAEVQVVEIGIEHDQPNRPRLDEVLDALGPRAREVPWTILDLGEVVPGDEPDRLPGVVERVQESDAGLELSHTELLGYARDVGQVIDGVFLGGAADHPSREETIAANARTATFLVAIVDSSFWLIGGPPDAVTLVGAAFPAARVVPARRLETLRYWS